METTPLVSVCVITFNHVDYIRQCLDGILMQTMSFQIEIILGEDESCDGTREICQDYANNHPDKIKLYLRSRNDVIYFKGKPSGRYNFIESLKACTGKYIALCEGDDYWTDPYKLQKQVDFLEANPDYEVCFTNIKVIRADGSTKLEQLIPNGRKDVYEQKDLPIWAPTLTRVFKNRNFSGKLPNAPGLDTVMLLHQSQFGKIKFLNEVTGVYRMHDGGIHSSKSKVEKTLRMFQTDLCSLEMVPLHLLPKYFGMLFKKLVEIYYLDRSLFQTNKNRIKKAYKKYDNKIPLTLQVKISSAFLLVSSIKILSSQIEKKIMLKILNHLFMY